VLKLEIRQNIEKLLFKIRSRSKISNMSEELDELPPSLRNVIDQKTLKWVFVGGKVKIEKSLDKS
jgi:hypothetical protein